jgi:hypothetical protein
VYVNLPGDVGCRPRLVARSTGLAFCDALAATVSRCAHSSIVEVVVKIIGARRQLLPEMSYFET